VVPPAPPLQERRVVNGAAARGENREKWDGDTDGGSRRRAGLEGEWREAIPGRRRVSWLGQLANPYSRGV